VPSVERAKRTRGIMVGVFYDAYFRNRTADNHKDTKTQEN
jgi:hypothetical protein